MAFFENDESGYRDWVQSHPLGFILVSHNPPTKVISQCIAPIAQVFNPSKALHKDNWTILYVKVCSESLEGLNTWATNKWGAGSLPLHKCGHCIKAGRL